MTCKELSLRLGHDANCLNVYRRKRDLPKKTSPLTIYELKDITLPTHQKLFRQAAKDTRLKNGNPLMMKK